MILNKKAQNCQTGSLDWNGVKRKPLVCPKPDIFPSHIAQRHIQPGTRIPGQRPMLRNYFRVGKQAIDWQARFFSPPVLEIGRNRDK